ncbi:MAG: hypothetical protein KH828_04620 [Clostridiales bacterium]|nr:hypothetical protein [Clostridiales bacterium]
MRIKEEKGVAMVEATIYMPLVLCTVMALIYLALFNLQEYMMLYQTQRVGAVVAREEAYIGYDVFGMGQDNEIDFSWGGGTPSSDKVTSYFEAHHDDPRSLYREIGGSGSADTGRFADAAVSSTLIALGTVSTPEVKVKNGFFGTSVTVEIKHSIPMPGVIAYLGYEGSTTLKAASYTYSLNPSEFVRNVDLGADLIKFVCDKLGVDINGFMGKAQEVLGKIL